MVREAFAKKVGERLRDYANRARSGMPPSWFGDEVLEQVEVKTILYLLFLFTFILILIYMIRLTIFNCM